MDVAFGLELVASITTIAQMWLYGNKSVSGPVWGLVANVAWWALTFWSGLWGLVPINLAMLFISVRNLRKWRTEAA